MCFCQLRRLADAFLHGSGVHKDALGPLAMFFENIAGVTGGPQLLCSEEYGFLLLPVARQIASEIEERKLGAAAAVKVHNHAYEQSTRTNSRTHARSHAHIGSYV